MREDKIPMKEDNTINGGKRTRRMSGWIIVSVIVAVLLLGAAVSSAFRKNPWGGKVLTDNLSEPLNGAKTAKIDINAGAGNLMISRLSGGEQALAGGTLQYFESQGLPTHTLNVSNGQAILTLRLGGTGRPAFRFPGKYDWQIHLNPTVSLDIMAHSDGGNVKLDLTGMTITRVFADTGGGNMEVILPDNAANLSVTAKTGGGNVVVFVPGGITAKVNATTGFGKVIVDPRFNKVDANTYQSPDYSEAANKVEITLGSGAGNVIVKTM